MADSPDNQKEKEAAERPTGFEMAFSTTEAVTSISTPVPWQEVMYPVLNLGVSVLLFSPANGQFWNDIATHREVGVSWAMVALDGHSAGTDSWHWDLGQVAALS